MVGQELRKERVLGNFRKRGLKPKRAVSRRLKRSGMSEAHLELIRLLPCCVSGRPARPRNDPHHLKGTGERGAGMRSTDRWAVPLAREFHDEVESVGSRNEVAWFRAHGIEDPHALAAALWAATGDLDRMTKILAANRRGR